jgi:hypothetical protein
MTLAQKPLTSFSKDTNYINIFDIQLHTVPLIKNDHGSTKERYILKSSMKHVNASQTLHCLDSEMSTRQDDALEKAEAKKESGSSAVQGMVGEKELDEAIGDSKGPDPEITSAEDDPLEKAEAAKEKK